MICISFGGYLWQSRRLGLHMIGNINPLALVEDRDPVIRCLTMIGCGCSTRKDLCEMGLFIPFSSIYWESSLLILFSRRRIAENRRKETTWVGAPLTYNFACLQHVF